MNPNRFSDFYCVYTFMQVVHTEFIKSRTEYPAFKSLSKMSQQQAAAAVIIALFSEKNKSRKKRWILRNSDSHKNYLLMTSERFVYE